MEEVEGELGVGLVSLLLFDWVIDPFLCAFALNLLTANKAVTGEDKP